MTTINKSTQELLSILLEERFNEIFDSNEWWRYEEIDDVLTALDDIGLNELRTKLKDKL